MATMLMQNSLMKIENNNRPRNNCTSLRSRRSWLFFFLALFSAGHRAIKVISSLYYNRANKLRSQLEATSYKKANWSAYCAGYKYNCTGIVRVKQMMQTNLSSSAVVNKKLNTTFDFPRYFIVNIFPQ